MTEEDFIIWALRGKNLRELAIVIGPYFSFHVCEEHEHCIEIPFARARENIHLKPDNNYECKGVKLDFIPNG